MVAGCGCRGQWGTGPRSSSRNSSRNSSSHPPVGVWRAIWQLADVVKEAEAAGTHIQVHAAQHLLGLRCGGKRQVVMGSGEMLCKVGVAVPGAAEEPAGSSQYAPGCSVLQGAGTQAHHRGLWLAGGQELGALLAGHLCRHLKGQEAAVKLCSCAEKKTGIHTAGAAWRGGTGEGIGWWSRGGGGPPVRSGTGGQAPQEWKAAGGAGWGGQATQPSAAVGRRWLGGADIIAVQRLLAPLPGGTTQPRPAGTSCALTKAPPELAVGGRLLLWPHIHHLDLAADTGRWRAWHEQGGSSKEGHVSLTQVHCRIASDKLLPSMIQQAGGSAGRQACGSAELMPPTCGWCRLCIRGGRRHCRVP